MLDEKVVIPSLICQLQVATAKKFLKNKITRKYVKNEQNATPQPSNFNLSNALHQATLPQARNRTPGVSPIIPYLKSRKETLPPTLAIPEIRT